MKSWKYRNNTNRTVLWMDRRWEPGDEKEIRYPVPSYLGLTCIQEGSGPDPVLCHEDVILRQGETTRIDVSGPAAGHKVALTLLCIGAGGAECRFNSEDSRPIPVDARPFTHTLPWEFCSVIYLKNIAEGETHISVSAVEVTD